MSTIKQTLSKKAEPRVSVVIEGVKGIESLYTKDQLRMLKWEAECMEEASRIIPDRKEGKKEYIQAAYEGLLKEHAKDPEKSLGYIASYYKKPESQASHIANLQVELNTKYEDREDKRQRKNGRRAFRRGLAAREPQTDFMDKLFEGKNRD